MTCAIFRDAEVCPPTYLFISPEVVLSNHDFMTKAISANFKKSYCVTPDKGQILPEKSGEIG